MNSNHASVTSWPHKFRLFLRPPSCALLGRISKMRVIWWPAILGVRRNHINFLYFHVPLPYSLNTSQESLRVYFIRPLGNGTLCFSELEEVVLDVEVALNNSPLSLVAETGKSVTYPVSSKYLLHQFTFTKKATSRDSSREEKSLRNCQT